MFSFQNFKSHHLNYRILVVQVTMSSELFSRSSVFLLKLYL